MNEVYILYSWYMEGKNKVTTIYYVPTPELIDMLPEGRLIQKELLPEKPEYKEGYFHVLMIDDEELAKENPVLYYVEEVLDKETMQ